MAFATPEADHFEGGKNLNQGHRANGDKTLAELLGAYKSGRVVAAGAGDEAVAFAEAFDDTDYTILVTFEDTAGGGLPATAFVKDATKAAGGFTLTVSAAGTYHWIARHD